MSWKLWLDDQLDDPATPNRRVPEGFLGAKSTYEAIKLIEANGVPEFMDLDFDLGGTHTAKSFLNFFQEKYPQVPIPEYQVHSRNILAREIISSFISSWKKSLESL